MLAENKGQASFEVMMVAVVVIALTIFLLTYFFNVFDSTTALTITKLDAIEKINALDSFHEIKKISFTELADGKTISLTIIVEPKILPQENFDDTNFNDTKSKISNQTKYTIVTISVD